MVKYPTSEEILDLVGKGFLIAIAWTSPYAGAALVKHLVIKAFDKAWEMYDQKRLRENIKRMMEQEMLEAKEMANGVRLVVTAKGKKKLLSYSLKKMKLNQPAVWDKKWRVVIFDVLESKRSARDALRRKIKDLGFYRLQKSVFVTPFPCEDEIAFLRAYFGVTLEVTCFLATELEQEEVLKAKFNLN